MTSQQIGEDKMQIVIDKDSMIKIIAITLYVASGGEYDNATKAANELLEEMGYTELPKGHGRLGDLDALEKLCTEHNIANSAYDNSPMIEQGHCSDGDCIWKPLFDFAPTIIEADTESEED